MTDDRRAVLEAIAYGDDPRLTPADRLRALEHLREFERTPLSVDVDLQPGKCRLTADATLSKRGRVTVRVVVRPT
jgi:hypothetical protein